MASAVLASCFCCIIDLKVGNVFHARSVGRGTNGPSLQGTKGFGNQDALVNLLDTMEIHLLTLLQRHCPPLVWEFLPPAPQHTHRTLNPCTLYRAQDKPCYSACRPFKFHQHDRFERLAGTQKGKYFPGCHPGAEVFGQARSLHKR